MSEVLFSPDVGRIDRRKGLLLLESVTPVKDAPARPRGGKRIAASDEAVVLRFRSQLFAQS